MQLAPAIIENASRRIMAEKQIEHLHGLAAKDLDPVTREVKMNECLSVEKDLPPVQFYPTLLPVAKAKGTLKPGIVK